MKKFSASLSFHALCWLVLPQKKKTPKYLQRKIKILFMKKWMLPIYPNRNNLCMSSLERLRMGISANATFRSFPIKIRLKLKNATICMWRVMLNLTQAVWVWKLFQHPIGNISIWQNQISWNLYQCMAETEQSALKGKYNLVSKRFITEVPKYQQGKWKY